MKKVTYLSVLIFSIDRIIKMLVDNFLEFEKPKYIINNFLYLFNCHNTGAAFSIFSNSTLFLIIISILVLIFLFFYLRKNNYKNSATFGILIGGLLGNLIDRIFFGYVIDYIGVLIFNYNFPIFNFADMAIVISIIILFFRM